MHKSTLFRSMITAAGLMLGTTPALHAAGDHGGGHQQSQGGDHEFAVGEPAEGAEADRTVKIVASDKMSFKPARVEVEPGQVVRFVVENTGTLHHSFTIGSKDWHRHHEEEMQGMAVDKLVDHMRGEPNGVVIPPGESRKITWEFNSGGPVPFGCHVPGHYPAGMKGRIHLG